MCSNYRYQEQNTVPVTQYQGDLTYLRCTKCDTIIGIKSTEQSGICRGAESSCLLLKYLTMDIL